MTSFMDELLQEMEWRVEEISTLKILPHLHKFSDLEKKVLEKYTIASIYSLWEGFVASAFSLYIKHINQMAKELRLSVTQICKTIIAHHMDEQYKLSDGRKNFEKKISLISNIFNFFQSPPNISTKIPTKSNVKFKVINEILERFNLKPLPDKPFKVEIDKLVIIRNNIAHGDVPTVNQSLIDALSISTTNAMSEVFNRIIEGYQNKSFLENSF